VSLEHEVSLQSLEVHKRSKKQFSTTQIRPHSSNAVKHWRTR